MVDGELITERIESPDPWEDIRHEVRGIKLHDEDKTVEIKTKFIEDGVFKDTSGNIIDVELPPLRDGLISVQRGNSVNSDVEYDWKKTSASSLVSNIIELDMNRIIVVWDGLSDYK